MIFLRLYNTPKLRETFSDQALLYLAFAPKVTAGGNLEHKKAVSQISAQGFAVENDPFLIAAKAHPNPSEVT